LKCRAEKGGIHKPFSDPADDQEFNCHDHNGNGRSSSNIWNQIWQPVTDSSCRCHQSADDSTQQTFAAVSGGDKLLRFTVALEEGSNKDCR